MLFHPAISSWRPARSHRLSEHRGHYPNTQMSCRESKLKAVRGGAPARCAGAAGRRARMDGSTPERTTSGGPVHHHCCASSRLSWLGNVRLGGDWSARNLLTGKQLGHGIGELPTSTQSPNLPVNLSTSSEGQRELLFKSVEADLLELRAAKGAAIVAQQIAIAWIARCRRNLRNP